MKCIGLLAVAVILSTLSVHPARALTCYAVTQGNHLITFDSTTPGTVTNDQTITGLDPAFSVVGIDIRTTTQTTGAANPGVGSLWGIAYNGTAFQLCVLNPTTGVATAIGGLLTMDDSAGPDVFGFGFDPSRDRFQFISVQTNYEVDPNTASFVQQTSFPGFPAHSGAAFTTASFGGTSDFYNISRQASPRTLQISTDISTGVLTPINPGGMGADIGQPLGMDIAGSLFLLADDGILYTVNRAAGTKTLVGTIMGMPTIRGLTIVPASFPPVAAVKVRISGKKRITTSGATATVKGTASSTVGIKRVECKVNRGKFKKARGTEKWKFKARLKEGRNVVTARAIGNNDVVSKPAKVRIMRE
jgi:hypothetical protein